MNFANVKSLTIPEGEVKQISVNGQVLWKKETLKIVDWETGTDEELAQMLEAHYNGTIDIHDYWNIGDTRRVTLSAMPATDGTVTVGETHAEQDVEFVLMDSTLDGIEPADTSISKLAFVVGMKDCLAETGYINATATNVGGWNGSKRRAWCNSIFANAMQASFRSLFKRFTWEMYGGYNSNPKLIKSNDLFALAPEMVIFGEQNVSHAEECANFTQWTYYISDSNKRKKTNGSFEIWWSGSARRTQNEAFCRVMSGGYVGYIGANRSHGISPFGCI